MKRPRLSLPLQLILTVGITIGFEGDLFRPKPNVIPQPGSDAAYAVEKELYLIAKSSMMWQLQQRGIASPKFAGNSVSEGTMITRLGGPGDTYRVSSAVRVRNRLGGWEAAAWEATITRDPTTSTYKVDDISEPLFSDKVISQ
jgi:hypothetical protein